VQSRIASLIAIRPTHRPRTRPSARERLKVSTPARGDDGGRGSAGVDGAGVSVCAGGCAVHRPDRLGREHVGDEHREHGGARVPVFMLVAFRQV